MRTARLLPVSPSMHCSGGVPSPGGTWSGGYLPGLGDVPGPGGGGYLPGPGGTWGVYLVQGVYLVPGGGGYLPGLRGIPAWSAWSGGVPAQVLAPCGQNSWHKLLKILPCPKLRLRAFNNHHWIKRFKTFHRRTRVCADTSPNMDKIICTDFIDWHIEDPHTWTSRRLWTFACE